MDAPTPEKTIVKNLRTMTQQLCDTSNNLANHLVTVGEAKAQAQIGRVILGSVRIRAQFGAAELEKEFKEAEKI
jgi:hypothetical protein